MACHVPNWTSHFQGAALFEIHEEQRGIHRDLILKKANEIKASERGGLTGFSGSSPLRGSNLKWEST
jgi:hypothetical protein